MRKTDKKVDNLIRSILTDVCEIALKEQAGFQWLTHLVNYSNFPKSLRIIYIFDTNENLKNFMTTNGRKEISTLIHKKFFQIGINISSITGHITYDTEENCVIDNNGNWADRLS